MRGSGRGIWRGLGEVLRLEFDVSFFSVRDEQVESCRL